MKGLTTIWAGDGKSYTPEEFWKKCQAGDCNK